MEIRRAELSDQVPRAQFFAELKSGVLELRKAQISKEVEELVDFANGTQSPPEKCPDPKMWNDFFEPFHSLEVGPINGREIFFKLVEEFPIMERLKQLEQIDVAIDRTIKRFMQVKSMKQMYRQLEPKVIAISQDKKIFAKK